MGILEADIIKQEEMKEKIKIEYFKRIFPESYLRQNYIAEILLKEWISGQSPS